MKVRAIEFSEGTPVTPDVITVEVTVEELAYIAMLTGRQSNETANAVMAGGDQLNYQIWGAAVGDVFNRYWSGGIKDYVDGVGRE